MSFQAPQATNIDRHLDASRSAVTAASNVTLAKSPSPGTLSQCVEGLKATFVLDGDLRVKCYDEAGEWLIAARCFGISIDNFRLRLRGAGHTMLRAVTNRDVVVGKSGAVVAIDHPALHASIMRLRSPSTAHGDAQWLLTVESSTRYSNFRSLGRRLGLTVTESDLLSSLCTDCSVATYAERRSKKLDTARTQLKRVLAKLGLHSQVELVRFAYATLYVH